MAGCPVVKMTDAQTKIANAFAALDLNNAQPEQLPSRIINAAVAERLDWREIIMLCERVEEETGLTILQEFGSL